MGRWGEGAEALGLTGTVTTEDLQSLCEGFSPDGCKLVQNAGKENRTPRWDFTFTAPKSVSVLWSQADGSIRREVERAHARAVEAALSWLEANTAFCRVGKDGALEARAKLAAALFDHSTNRNQEPNLHTHCLVVNVGVTEGGAPQQPPLRREDGRGRPLPLPAEPRTGGEAGCPPAAREGMVRDRGRAPGPLRAVLLAPRGSL